MKRAQAHEVSAAFLELHILAHDVDHVDAGQQLLDERLGDGHWGIFTDLKVGMDVGKSSACIDQLITDIIGNIMKIVLLDTNVLVAALTSSRGASYALLQAVASARLRMAASPAVWLEYEAVLKRDEIRELHGFSTDQVDSFLSALAVWVEPVSLHYIWRPQLRDPGDEMVLEAAVNARVDALVTSNVKDFSMAAPRFGLAVKTPAQALSFLEVAP